MRRQMLLAGTVLGALLLSSGCGIQPWVKPYERDRLADPIMAWDRDAISNAYLDHIRESREGSRGATGGACSSPPSPLPAIPLGNHPGTTPTTGSLKGTYPGVIVWPKWR